jgi:hypothetical protein
MRLPLVEELQQFIVSLVDSEERPHVVTGLHQQQEALSGARLALQQNTAITQEELLADVSGDPEAQQALESRFTLIGSWERAVHDAIVTGSGLDAFLRVTPADNGRLAAVISDELHTVEAPEYTPDSPNLGFAQGAQLPEVGTSTQLSAPVAAPVTTGQTSEVQDVNFLG